MIDANPELIPQAGGGNKKSKHSKQNESGGVLGLDQVAAAVALSGAMFGSGGVEMASLDPEQQQQVQKLHQLFLMQQQHGSSAAPTDKEASTAIKKEGMLGVLPYGSPRNAAVVSKLRADENGRLGRYLVPMLFEVNNEGLNSASTSDASSSTSSEKKSKARKSAKEDKKDSSNDKSLASKVGVVNLGEQGWWMVPQTPSSDGKLEGGTPRLIRLAPSPGGQLMPTTPGGMMPVTPMAALSGGAGSLSMPHSPNASFKEFLDFLQAPSPRIAQNVNGKKQNWRVFELCTSSGTQRKQQTRRIDV